MKLVVGLGSVDDYAEYVEAGADEVFIGYVPMCWQQTYGLGTPLNRREVCFYNVQIGSYSELEILAEEVEKKSIGVTVAFNGLSFSEEQYPIIAQIMRECLSLGFRDVIIADMGLLLYLNQIGLTKQLKLHISGEFGEINHYILEEFTRLGARRIIFHRAVSLRDMEQIINICGKALEYEVFLLNENCHFTGGYCNSLHCDELVPMCRMPYQTDVEEEERMSESAESFHYDYHLSDLEQLQRIGVTHLKIVGRGADTDYMIHCIRSAKEQLWKNDL